MVGRSRGLSRRGLLGAGAVAAGAGSMGLLGACDRSSPAPRNFTRFESEAIVDLDQLQGAIDIENMTIAAYRSVSAVLRGRELDLARRLLSQEQEHLARLSHFVGLINVAPNAPRPSYGFPRLASSGAALAFATEVENIAIAAYIDALPKFAHPSLRAVAASIMNNEAEHASVLALAQGRPGAPSAFVRGRA